MAAIKKVMGIVFLVWAVLAAIGGGVVLYEVAGGDSDLEFSVMLLAAMRLLGAVVSGVAAYFMFKK